MINRPSDREAQITYAPDTAAQKEASADGIAGKFVVEYDVERTQSGGDILVRSRLMLGHVIIQYCILKQTQTFGLRLSSRKIQNLPPTYT